MDAVNDATRDLYSVVEEPTWEQVEEYFVNGGKKCADCPSYHEWREGRGYYGSAPAFETMSECKLLESGDGKPEDCPGVAP